MVDSGKLASVAQLPKSSLIFSPNEKIPLYYKDIHNHILLSNDENIKSVERAREYETFSRFEKIAANPSAIAAYKIFLQNGCSFAKEISKLCETSLATAYRAIENLSEIGLILPLSKLNLPKAPGPAPSIYGVETVTEKEVQSAVIRYKKSRSKVFTYVEQVYQRTLDEVQDEQIQYTKILYWARQIGTNGFHISYIADEAAKQLQDHGVKVWK